MHAWKNPTFFTILAMRCTKLQGSSGTVLISGMYLTTVDLQCKNREGFNLDSPTAIPEALPEEVRVHTKGFEAQVVPTTRGYLRFTPWHPPC